MKINESVKCAEFSCDDVKHECYIVPEINVDPEGISIIMISEAAPANPGDYYYAGEDALFAQTTVQAFNDAGADVSSVQNILDLGVYLTTAVKCGNRAGLFAPQAKTQQIDKQMVIPIPTPLVIQWEKEQVGRFQRLKDCLTVLPTRDSVAQRSGHTLED